jgi:hypothetical protein
VRNLHTICSESLKGTDHLGDLRVIGRIALKVDWILYDSGCGPAEGACEHDNEYLDSIHAGNSTD